VIPALTASRSGQWARRHHAWIVVGLIAVLSFGVRVRLRDMALERDEGEYAYAGQLMLHGVPPYVAAYNMKLPGTYAAYAIIMAVFGQTPSGIHFGLALVNVSSIILIFLIGRKLLDPEAAMAAAVAFGLLSTGTSILGLAAHATHFVTCFALLGIWFLLLAHERQRRRDFALSGLCFGLSFLMKQHGIFFGIFGGIYLLYDPIANAWSRKGRGSRFRIGTRAGSRERPASRFGIGSHYLSTPLFALLLYFAGFLFPYLLTCGLLAATGAFHSFWFWTVSYAGKYASDTSLAQGPEMLRAGLRVVIGPNLGLWIFPWVGALVIWWDQRRETKTRFFLFTLLICSFASVSVGLFFREHYFITLMPILALFIGEAFSRAWYLLRKDRTIELFTAVPILGGLAISLGAALLGNMNCWLAQSPAEVSRLVYHTTLFNEARALGDFIRQNAGPNATVAVIGSEPEIYFYAHRRSATGYLYMYPLTEHHPFARHMQEEMIQELERARPDYAVYVDDRYSWLFQADSDRTIFEWWENYWVKNLSLMKTVSYQEGGAQQTGYVDPFSKESAPEAESCRLLLFERKDRADQRGSLVK
jgi:4-amino-4-deoxy-L-arabinose transferase-like glycosyltransferase